jgi:hypothetical protein
MTSADTVSSLALPPVVQVVQQNPYPHLEKFLQKFTGPKQPGVVREYADTALKALLEDPSVAAEDSIRALFNQLRVSAPAVERIMWDEVYDSLADVSDDLFFHRLEQLAENEQALRKGLISLRDLERDLETEPSQMKAAEACERSFRGTLLLVDNARLGTERLSTTRFALWVGRAGSGLDRMDRVFAKAFRQSPHQYCGCHALQGRVRFLPGLGKQLIPLTPPKMALPLAGETVAIFGCEWGAGHKMPAQGIGELCRDHLGAHVYTFNLPDDVLPPTEDAVFNSPLNRLGFKSVTQFFNALMRENAFAIINWTQSGAAQPDPEGQARRVLYIMRRLLETNATCVITTYSKHNEELILACEKLGLPLIHIATDIKNYITTRARPPKYEHFVMALPVDLPNATHWGKVKEEQMLVTGPFVRTAFRRDRTEADIAVLQDKWKIPPGKKVLVFCDSGNGASLAYVDEIRKRYEDEDAPYHCFVLCRGDKALAKKVQDMELPWVRSIEFATADQMEELSTLAAYGGAMISKSGGSTVFECLRTGTRLITPNMPSAVFGSGFTHAIFGTLNKLAAWSGSENQLPWERMNFDYMADRNQAAQFTAVDQFMAVLKQLTDGQTKPVPHGDLPHFEEQIMKLIPSMLASVRADNRAMRARMQIEEVAGDDEPAPVLVAPEKSEQVEALV